MHKTIICHDLRKMTPILKWIHEYYFKVRIIRFTSLNYTTYVLFKTNCFRLAIIAFCYTNIGTLTCTTNKASIFRALTIVRAPSVMSTVIYAWLVSIATYVVKPNMLRPASEIPVILK